MDYFHSDSSSSDSDDDDVLIAVLHYLIMVGGAMNDPIGAAMRRRAQGGRRDKTVDDRLVSNWHPGRGHSVRGARRPQIASDPSRGSFLSVREDARMFLRATRFTVAQFDVLLGRVQALILAPRNIRFSLSFSC